jgi:hypothetical protein
MDNIPRVVASIPVDEYADAAIKARGDGHLMCAEQGRIHPTELTSCDCGEFGVQIRCRAENNAGNIFSA